MLSVFLKKSKMKNQSIIKQNNLNINETELNRKIDSKEQQSPNHQNMTTPNTNKPPITTNVTKRKKRHTHNVKSISSPETTHIRRTIGNSVTFESTLPTQIWQASPSPSPPPLPMKPLSEQIRKKTSYKLDHKSLKNWKLNKSYRHKLNMSNKSLTNQYLGNLTDPDDLNDDDDESSDETNPFSLSSCTSSDETTTSQEKLNYPPNSNSTTDSSSSLDLHLLPDIHTSNNTNNNKTTNNTNNNDIQYRHLKSNQYIKELHKNKHKHHHHHRSQKDKKKHKHINGITISPTPTLTTTTPANIITTSITTTTNTIKSICNNNYANFSDSNCGISFNHSKTSSSDSNSDSSSSSSDDDENDEDLQIYGWDEKSIAMLTNRNKLSRLTSTYNSSNKLNKLMHKSDNYTNNSKLVNPNHCKESNWKPEQGLLKLKLNSPVRILNHLSIDMPNNYPQTCILTRRANSMTQSGRSSVTGSLSQSSNLSSNHQIEFTKQSTDQTELLAIVVIDYKPSAEWKDRYKLLNVRQGDYVCIISQTFPCSVNSSSNGKHINLSQSDCKELSQTNHNTNKNNNNLWLYVRRWCVDHLIVTGTPGYVPRQNCRILSSYEITNLWQTSHKSKASLWKSGANLSKLTNSFENETLTNDPGSNTKEKIILADELVQTPKTINNHINNHISTVSNNFRAHISCTGHVPIIYSTQLTRRNPMYELQSYVTNPSQNCLPPPPPGFGSGGSIGSETEDKDSGRGPSSGSEWGSGRGGSSNITLDRSLVEQTSSEGGLESHLLQITGRTRNVKSVEESQLGWYIPTNLLWPEYNYHQGEECLSRDSAFQSPNIDELTPPLLQSNLKDNQKPNSNENSVTSHQQTQLQQQPQQQQHYLTSPVTLTTRTGNTPVLEMRPNGTPTLYARGISISTLNGSDSLATSTTTCTTVIETKENPDEYNNQKMNANINTNTVDNESNNNNTSINSKNSSICRMPTPDPSCWEPYKTVIHVNENSLEKFTLV